MFPSSPFHLLALSLHPPFCGVCAKFMGSKSSVCGILLLSFPGAAPQGIQPRLQRKQAASCFIFYSFSSLHTLFSFLSLFPFLASFLTLTSADSQNHKRAQRKRASESRSLSAFFVFLRLSSFFLSLSLLSPLHDVPFPFLWGQCRDSKVGQTRTCFWYRSCT